MTSNPAPLSAERLEEIKAVLAMLEAQEPGMTRVGGDYDEYSWDFSDDYPELWDIWMAGITALRELLAEIDSRGQQVALFALRYVAALEAINAHPDAEQLRNDAEDRERRVSHAAYRLAEVSQPLTTQRPDAAREDANE